MRPHIRFCLATGLVLVSLLSTTPQAGLATTVFDDHFTGNSGGVPAGWSIVLGAGSVVEDGTTVTLGQDIVAIGSDAVLDPSSGTVTIETDITGIAGQIASGLVVPGEFPVTFFICEIRTADGRIEVTGGDVVGGMQSYNLGKLTGYAGGPVRLTVNLGPTSFSVSTDSPQFSSGPIEYAKAFATFTREDLGTAGSVVLMDYEDPGSSVVDRVRVDVEESTPVESATFGFVKTLFRR